MEKGNTMKAAAFFELVADMRDAQKSYFANRDRESLDRSKRLEANVDKYLANYKKWKDGQATK